MEVRTLENIAREEIIEAFLKAVHQFNVLENSEENWKLLLTGMATVTKNVRIINIDAREEVKTKWLERFGLENFLDQYEMEYRLSP